MGMIAKTAGEGASWSDTSRSTRLLLAEDDELLRRVFARAFRAEGFEVDVAADGEAALALLKDKRFDAILTDIAMPRLSGIDLLRAVRQHDSDVPIVLMTGGPELATALQAIEHGAFRYLVKPVELSELKSIVRRAASFHRLAQLKREALAVLGENAALKDDRASLERTFERAGLDEVKDARARVESLKRMGYRIAVDDLGAGYAGLTSFAQLEPHIVKLDMSLVRNVHEAPTKRKLIQSIVALCRDLGIEPVGEGVETAAERDVLEQLGCTLLQGYLFGKPEREFLQPKF